MPQRLPQDSCVIEGTITEEASYSVETALVSSLRPSCVSRRTVLSMRTRSLQDVFDTLQSVVHQDMWCTIYSTWFGLLIQSREGHLFTLRIDCLYQSLFLFQVVYKKTWLITSHKIVTQCNQKDLGTRPQKVSTS